MEHWLLSNFPWKGLGFILLLEIVAFVFVKNEDVFGFAIFSGLLGVMFFIMASFIPLDKKFKEIIEEILITEFLNKRPFKEVSSRRQDILEEILSNVNKKVNHIMGTNYGYPSINELMHDYSKILFEFHDVYVETPTEEI